MQQNSLSPSRLFLLLTVSILLLSSCSSLKRANHHIEDDLESAPVFQQGFAGLAVYDPEEHRMLFEHNSDKYFTPASNTKLFTFYTGLKILGDSVPALKYTIKNDSLIFEGTGDPSLLYPDLPDSQVLSFLKNTGDSLYFVPPIYTESYFGPGWAWDDYNAYYSVERTPLPIYGNRVYFSFRKGQERPKSFPKIFKDSLLVSADTTNSRIRRELAYNGFSFENTLKTKDFEQEVPFKYSPHLLVNLLQDTLQKKVNILHNLPPKVRLDKTLYSIPADSMYKHMLQVSDNFIAEQILLMAAQKISDSLKTEIAIDYMKKNYLKDLPDEPIWVDGSGLSRYNLFTPRTMVKLLEKISEEVPREKLFDMLPTGGKSGTLKNYYKAEEPYIYAKTGTLSNNHSLSGFLITKKGKVLIFSFMNSNYTVPTSSLKAGMENILESIRDNY